MKMQPAMQVISEGFIKTVQIASNGVALTGDWVMPASRKTLGIILFAHGSGSSRHSTRNKAVARYLESRGMGTLLLDLLTPEEEGFDEVTAQLRFDIPLLAQRLCDTTHWLAEQPEAHRLPLGYFGASTGAAAALMAAAELRSQIAAVVSRGGRPDLAGEALPYVISPTLLLVGERDVVVGDLNRDALDRLHCVKELVIIPGASHLFEEQGTLEQVAEKSADWFSEYFVVWDESLANMKGGALR